MIGRAKEVFPLIRNFDELKAMLAACPVKRRIGVVAAQDEHTLEAVAHAARDGMVFPVLIGDVEKISAILKTLNYPAENAELIPGADPAECAEIACAMVKEGKLDCIMKGKTETGPLMKVLVNREKGIRKADTMSMLGMMWAPNYHKIFAITDVGLLTYPTKEQKKAAIENAVGAFHALGIKEPKVAILAAVETVNPKMPECVDAAAIKEEGVPGCIIEGPISYDLAMEKAAAEIKGYQSPVAGDADILVVPNICCGNVAAKTITSISGGATCGTVLGARVPVCMTSRSATAQDKYMSIVLNALIGGGR